MQKIFSIKEAFVSGFDHLGNNIGVFAAVFGILFGSQAVFGGLGGVAGVIGAAPVLALPALFLRFSINAVSFIVSMLITAGLLKVVLQVYDGKKLELSDAVRELFVNHKYLVNLVLASMLTGLIFLGLAAIFLAVLILTMLAPYLNLNVHAAFGLKAFFLGLPHNLSALAEFIGIALVFLATYIYLLTRISFYMYLIVDKDLGPVESIKKSFEMTAENFWKLIGFQLSSFGVMIIGFLCCCIGIFAAIPVCWVARAYVYRKLLAEVTPASAGQNP